MIHLFEGFLVNTESNIYRYGNTRLNNEFVFSGLHTYCFQASPSGSLVHDRYSTFLASNTAVELQGQDNFTIGVRCKLVSSNFSAGAGYYGSLLVRAKKTDTLDSYLTSSANHVTLPGHALPYLMIAGDVAGTHHNINLNGVNIDVPGVSVYDEHFYELEYRISEGLILVHIDNVEVYRDSFDYSVIEEGEYRTVLSFATRQYSGSSCNATVGALYAADERLGPVSVKRLTFSGDAERSADVLGPGSVAERLNDRETIVAGVPYVEKDNQQFLLSAAGLSGNEDVLSARMLSNFSSEEQSALEVARPVSLIISSAGQIEEGTPFIIPREGYETRLMYLHDNPFTNQPWTPSALQSMTYGVKFGTSE